MNLIILILAPPAKTTEKSNADTSKSEGEGDDDDKKRDKFRFLQSEVN